MKDLIIGDCHFGVKNNSLQWLEYQLLFFKEQVISEISSNKYDRVILLGDIFDIRYSINQYIGYEVKCMFRELSTNFPNIAYYIIAGNHDYYSPNENYSQYNAYNLIFGYEFSEIHTNIHIIQDGYLIEDNTIFAPWYSTENFDNFKLMMEDIKSYKNPPKLMYCHSDLSTWSIENKLSLKPKNLTVISGHIHNAQQDKENRLYNVGSIFPINFNDVNNKKYLYHYDTDTEKFVEAFENITTPKFIEFYDEEIFTISNDDLKNCFVRIFINSENINKIKYIEKLSEIKKNYEYEGLKIQTVSNNILNGLQNNSSFNANNISEYIDNNIPENLNNKYQYIKQIIENSK